MSHPVLQKVMSVIRTRAVEVKLHKKINVCMVCSVSNALKVLNKKKLRKLHFLIIQIQISKGACRTLMKISPHNTVEHHFLFYSRPSHII